MIQDKMKIILKKETKKVQLFLNGLELLCIIGQNLYKSDAGAKRACKKAEGLSSWMMDAVKSATGVTRTRPVTRLLWGSAREHRTEGKSLLLACWEGTNGPRRSRLGVGHTN